MSRYTVVKAGPLAVKVERRSVGVCAVLASVIVVLGVGALLIGDYTITVWQSVQAVFGIGEDWYGVYTVQNSRAPRVVCAVLVGAALAVSGAIFQSLSGNPLGSPDIIGFTTGAASGALVQIIVFDGGPAAISVAALLGGFGTAALVYLFAWREGLAGYRLVLVGIGIAVMLEALNTLLVVRAELGAAQTAIQWLAGSLNAKGWSDVALVGAALVVLLPPALALSRSLAMLSMGDDAAAGVGVRVERARLLLVLIGVALVALATAVCGPIAFIALAAPQLARRLTRSVGVGMIPAALMGGALVLASDLIARRIVAPDELAVGVVSGSLGGLYLIWLLAREWRRKPA